MNESELHERSAELFHAACELPEEERYDFVRDQADGDAALVRATVRLLGADLAGGHTSFLSTQSAFAHLSPQVLGVLADRMQPRYYASAMPILCQGDPGDSLLVLQRGEAEVRLSTGGRTHVLARLGPGDVLGEMALVTGAPRNADIVSVTPVKALELSSNDFYEAMVRYSEVAHLLTNIVADRLGRSLVDGLGGKVLQGYRITRPIGRGAMAVVYEADPLNGGERVALKMMSHRLSLSDTAMVRFEHEATLVESLRHPAVARCHGRFGAYGTHFMVMEYLDGPELGDVIRGERPLPEAEIRKILGSLALSLAHVHAGGIVHGDIKPANVMLTRKGEVKLTDFGIATAMSEIKDGDGTIGGTPWYMAPEQFQAQSPPSPLADVYALGCLLWEMITGNPLFAENDMTALVWKKDAFVMPRAKDIRPGLSRDLYDALSRTLQHDPEARAVDLPALGRMAGTVDPELVRRVLASSQRVPRPGSAGSTGATGSTLRLPPTDA